jgi:hypothetical protein
LIIKWKYLSLIFIVFLFGCDNPFAPKISNNVKSFATIKSQATIEGVFDNIKYAYLFKDTTTYSKVLAEDFIFSYRDYEKNIEISWNKQEELRITNTLFKNAEELNLYWNDIIALSEDSSQVIRNFQLKIRFSSDEIVQVDGKVKLVLTKLNKVWYIKQWYDDSNF